MRKTAAKALFRLRFPVDFQNPPSFWKYARKTAAKALFSLRFPPDFQKLPSLWKSMRKVATDQRFRFCHSPDAHFFSLLGERSGECFLPKSTFPIIFRLTSASPALPLRKTARQAQTSTKNRNKKEPLLLKRFFLIFPNCPKSNQPLLWPILFLNLSIRPPVSTSFCLPV